MVSIDLLVSLVPLFPLLGFLIVALNVRKLSHGVVSLIACGVILLSFFASVYLFILLLNLPEESRSIFVTLFDWIKTDTFSASFSFLVDPLSSLMLLIITGVGFFNSRVFYWLHA